MSKLTHCKACGAPAYRNQQGQLLRHTDYQGKPCPAYDKGAKP